jgi:uncharacterized protein YdiU (UPF0061 family)
MLPNLRLAHSFVRALPGDLDGPNRPRQVPGVSFSRVMPTPVASPRLLAWSDDVATMLGLPRREDASEELVELLAGNLLRGDMEPFAARYGGHQFGNWAGQLGDGRAITLMELVNDAGEAFEVQLKGAGPTPYSRRGDGRAVLRSSLREFLCSEAMFHLGVPTTRALSLVATGDKVLRDMFYDGRAAYEPGAIVARVAKTFIRFGNFELHASLGETDALRKLIDYTVTRNHPELGAVSDDTVLAWLDEVARRTAVMVAHWMRIGFVHGVMNTDNMSVLGVTIDYGPYGFLDTYDPDFTPNTTDAHGRRYRYANQPGVAHWNLAKLARAVGTSLADPKSAERCLDVYRETFASAFGAMVAAKLGLRAIEGDPDETLASDLMGLLGAVETDPTIFYRRLADLDVTSTAMSDVERVAVVAPAFYDERLVPGEHRAALAAWLVRYAERARQDGLTREERRAIMNAANPKYLPRNYLAQEAIDAAEQGDLSKLDALLRCLRAPYDEQPEYEHLAAKRPDWARNKPGCSALSCSS